MASRQTGWGGGGGGEGVEGGKGAGGLPAKTLAPLKGGPSRLWEQKLSSVQIRRSQLEHNCYPPLPQKRGLKSLGLIRATGQEIQDNHYVLHLTPTLHLAITFLGFFEIRTCFQCHNKVAF